MLDDIKSRLQQAAVASPKQNAIFYKTGVGEYAEHDRFMGITVPTLRRIAKDFPGVSLADIQRLLESPFNEERFLALVLLATQYKKAIGQDKEEYYQFYLDNLNHVNNWNLVDASAHLIVGAHLLNVDKTPLLKLVQSDVMWERRVAIVSTWYFIRNHQLDWTFKLSKMLLQDTHDLIHKAVGWMLREAGKKDVRALMTFLDDHAPQMPRTMLRYALEKFSHEERKTYLGQR